MLNLKIISDINCDVYVDNTFITTAKKDQVEIIPLESGEYILKCVGAYSAECKIEHVLELTSPKVVTLSFKEILKSHPEWMRDSNFAYSETNQSFYHIATQKEITTKKYESGSSFILGKALVQYEGKWGYIDKMGVEVVPCQYVDKSMMFKEVLSCRYEYIDDFHDGMAMAKSEENLYGFINEEGIEVIPCSFTQCTIFNRGIAGIKKEYNWVFIDKFGNEIGQCGYNDIAIYSDGLFRVQQEGKLGIVDSSCSEVLPSIYDDISNCNDANFAKVRIGDKYGLIDRNGIIVLPCIYAIIQDYENDLACVRRDGKNGLVNRNGDEVIPCEYDSDIEFIDDISIVRRDGECGAINRDNEVVVPFKYGGISKFINGIAYVRDHGKCIGTLDTGKYGIVDIAGHELVQCKYSSIGSFTEGRAKVCYDGKYGYIDTSGVEIILPQYDYIGNFVKGIAQVKKGRFYGFIDIYGTEIVPCVYSKIEDFKDGFVKVKQGDKEGLIASNGQEIVPCSYSYVDFSNGIAQVKNEKDLWGLFDSKGYMISPCIYDAIREADRQGLRLGLIKEQTLPAYLDNRYNGLWRLFYEMPNDEFETLWKRVSHQMWGIKDDEIITEKKAYLSNYIDGLAIVKIIVNRKHFYSIISHTQELIVPCIYSDIVNVSNELFRVELGGKLGLVNKNGEEVVPCKYTWIDVLKNGYAIVRIGGAFVGDTRKYGLIDSFGHECIPCQYEFIKEAADDTYLVNLNGKWGIVNECNEVLLDFKYDWVDEFKDGRAIVKVMVKCFHPWEEDVYHWGLIADDGKELIPCICKEIVDFKNDIFTVNIDGYWGLADKYGNTIISCEYRRDEIVDFTDEFIKIKTGRYHTSLIKQIPFKNVPIGRQNKVLQNGTLIKVNRNGMYGCQDIDGNEIIPCKYGSMDDFVDGLAKVYRKGGYGYIDLLGNEVIPCQYHSIGRISDGCAIISITDGYNKENSILPIVKFGIINIKGEEIVKCIYDEVNLFEDGISRVKKDGKWGFINRTGKQLIPTLYDDVKSFKDGLAAVKIGKKWGFIDMHGREIIHCKYDLVGSFNEGYACVANVYSQQYIGGDEMGDVVWDLYKCGLVNKSGYEILPLIYDTLEDFNDGYAIVKQQNKYGVINTDLAEVLPCVYGWIQDCGEEFKYSINETNAYISKQTDLRILNYYDECLLTNNHKLRLVRKLDKWGICSIECYLK